MSHSARRKYKSTNEEIIFKNYINKYNKDVDKTLGIFS